MQHGGDADPGAKMLRVGGDCDGGFGRCLEQDVVDDGLVLIGDVGDRAGQRVDEVEVGYRQQLGLALFQPRASRCRLALGAVPVAAGVVGDDRVGASFAACNMTTESRRAAALDGRHHLQLAEAHMAGVGCAPCRAEVAEDIRNLQDWTGHDCLSRLCSLASLAGCLARLAQHVEWAGDDRDHAGGHPGVAGCGVELVVTKQSLDHTDVGSAFEQMSGKAVAQRMQRHRLPDAGRVGRLVKQPIELSCRHRLSGGAAREQPALFPRHAVIVAGGSHLPPLPQQIERPGRQHDVSVLAPLGLHDADDVLGAVDIAGPQPDHLAGAQTGAVAESQHDVNLEIAGHGQQALGLVRADHQRDLLGFPDVVDLGGKVQPPERHAEQELEPGHDPVAIADAQSCVDQVQLEQPDIVGCGRIGRALQVCGKPLAAADVTLLRMRSELARAHILDHALAKWADGIGTHGELS